VIAGKNPSGRRSEREPFITDVDLVVGAEVIQAMTVDLSDTGLRIDMDRPLNVRIRFLVDGVLVDRKAQFARAEKTPDGGMTYGIEFSADEA